MSSVATNTIALKSYDGETFEVEAAAFAAQSEAIRRAVNDNVSVVSVPDVTSEILVKVIDYCNRHCCVKSEDAADLVSFDAEFVKVDPDSLCFLLLAADYLKINSLTDLTCEAIRNLMEGKTVEEIREIFNIKNDYTPEEEEEIRRENSWAFE